MSIEKTIIEMPIKTIERSKIRLKRYLIFIKKKSTLIILLRCFLKLYYFVTEIKLANLPVAYISNPLICLLTAVERSPYAI